MMAYQFIAKDRAGLALVGRDEDGGYLFAGTSEQWNEADANEMEFEEDFNDWPEPPRSNVEWPLV